MCKFRMSSWSISSLAAWLFSSAMMNSSSSSEKLSVNGKNESIPRWAVSKSENTISPRTIWVWMKTLTMLHSFENFFDAIFIVWCVPDFRHSWLFIYYSKWRKVKVNIYWLRPEWGRKWLKWKRTDACSFVVFIIVVTVLSHLIVVAIVCVQLPVTLWRRIVNVHV